MARRMLRRRRRALKRYKQPSTSNYFRYKVDFMSSISKRPGELMYEWAGGATAVYTINLALMNNANFANFCKQYSYVRIKAMSYLSYPDTRNQVLNESGYVALTVWPRGYLDSYGTWDKCADNPFFKILNPTQSNYKYCNLLGGDNDWKSTNSTDFTSAQVYVNSSYGADVARANAPQWLVKISVYCVFKSPVQ